MTRRNTSKAWMAPGLCDCLRRHNTVWVLRNQTWMPSPLRLVRRLDVVTGPFAHVRLLGDREAAGTPTLPPGHQAWPEPAHLGCRAIEVATGHS
jgi:hypothetical protein